VQCGSSSYQACGIESRLPRHCRTIDSVAIAISGCRQDDRSGLHGLRTGKIRVPNVWCAIDCGLLAQPDNVVAHTESSIVNGAGLALTERVSIKDGAVEQSNFYDYIVSRNRNVPPMQVIRADYHPTGVGKMATPSITPAVSNAMMALTAVRLWHAPFTEERVKKALA